MTLSTQPIRILIADDHGIMRAGLRSLLAAEPDMKVVGEAASSAEALQKAAAVRPDIAILDVSMPGAGGIEVVRQIRSEVPGVRTLMLTVHEDDVILREALKAGASGYIVKRAIESELLTALRTIHRGETYVHPVMTDVLIRSVVPPRTADPSVDSLTPRETEVLQHIALGYTNRQIAELLRISVRTVESHRANLMGKLHLQGRAALVRYARDHGLLDD